jgi:hypothetical protein
LNNTGELCIISLVVETTYKGGRAPKKQKHHPKREFYLLNDRVLAFGCPDLWIIITVEKNISSLIYSLCLSSIFGEHH